MKDRPGTNAVAVISHALWTRRFGGDRRLIGRAILLDGKPATVVGVLPVRKPLPGPQQLGDLVRLHETIDVFRPKPRSPPTNALLAISITEGGAPAARIVGRGAAEPSWTRSNRPSRDRPRMTDGSACSSEPLHDSGSGTRVGPLVVLLAATPRALIVCVNLANLLLARHAGRRRDQAIRTALGAAARTLVAETLTRASSCWCGRRVRRRAAVARA